jgi:hypothetical protein
MKKENQELLLRLEEFERLWQKLINSVGQKKVLSGFKGSIKQLIK